MAHMVYGPWGPDKNYIWIDADKGLPVDDDRPKGPTIHVQPNIAYESPVDGRPVTTWAKRRDDMARSGCIDAREARERAADARRNWKTGLEGLTLGELERQRRY